MKVGAQDSEGVTMSVMVATLPHSGGIHFSAQT